MNKREIRFTTWIISITSILYGLASIGLLIKSNFYDQGSEIACGYVLYIPFLALIASGIMKVIGLSTKRAIVRRVSMVGLMFSWGFIWTADLVSFFAIGPNRGAILIIPILAICTYLAMRGDYFDE